MFLNEFIVLHCTTEGGSLFHSLTTSLVEKNLVQASWTCVLRSFTPLVLVRDVLSIEITVIGPDLTGLLRGMASLTTRRTPSDRRPAVATPKKVRDGNDCCRVSSMAQLGGDVVACSCMAGRGGHAPQSAAMCPRPAMCPESEFDTGLNPMDAMDAIGKLVLQTSNQVMRWSEFFNTCQAFGESGV